LVSIDVSGAFDRVRWSAILNIFQKYKIAEDVVQIVKEFLVERTVGLYTDEHLTPGFLFNLSAGVPQGLVLGPIIFNIVMSTLHHEVMDCGQEMVSYVDDLVLVSGIGRIEDLTKINKTINKVEQGLRRLGLEFNGAKTFFLIVSRKHDWKIIQNAAEQKIRVSRYKITASESIKYLKHIVDQKLNFTEHVKNQLLKIQKCYNLFGSLYVTVSEETHLMAKTHFSRKTRLKIGKKKPNSIFCILSANELTFTSL
jgi:hypothetical protein